MKFTGFSAETFEFLLQLAFHNEKSYFEAHRAEFEKYVKYPMNALEQELQPFIVTLDTRLRTGPLAVSRIYRDTRFSKDKTPFRDHMWIDYRPPKTRTSEFASLYTGITPVGYSTGFGMYCANTTIMTDLRGKIQANPARFLSIVEDKALTKRFALNGSSYVRKRFSHSNSTIEAWLNFRNFHYSFESGEIMRTMQADFAQEILSDFKILKPLYQFIYNLS